MRITNADLVSILIWTSLLTVNPGKACGQNQPAPVNHVVIPNPTPRPPDLKKEYDDNGKDREKQKELSIQSQLRAREIWLETNQLLLLAQQLDQEIHSAGKVPPMGTEAAKVGKIQKLAQSIQDKMKSH